MEMLVTRYNGRKSFNYKAMIQGNRRNNKNVTELYSYGVLVAYVDDNKNMNVLNIPKVFSKTTTSHLVEFYRQFVENREVTKEELKKFLVEA